MRATCLCLAVLFAVPFVDAAPAPTPGQKAKVKLEALKKRLPDLVDDWLKKRPNDGWLTRDFTCKPEIRLVRQVGSDRAKVVILFSMVDGQGTPFPSQNLVLTVFLSFYDGSWTIERSEVAGRLNGKGVRPTFAFLMMAIDKAAEKP
jgi:hypothetical protein